MDNNNKYSFAEHVKNREFFTRWANETFTFDLAIDNSLYQDVYQNRYTSTSSLAEKTKEMFSCMPVNDCCKRRVFSFCLREAVRNHFNDKSFFVESEYLTYRLYRENAIIEFYKNLIDSCKKYSLFFLEKKEAFLVDGKDKLSSANYDNECSKEDAMYFFKYEYSLDHIRGYSSRAFDDYAELLDNAHRNNIFYGTLFDFCNNDLNIFLVHLEVACDNEIGRKKLYSENSEKQIARKLFIQELKVRLVIAFSDALRKKINYLANSI